MDCQLVYKGINTAFFAIIHWIAFWVGLCFVGPIVIPLGCIGGSAIVVVNKLFRFKKTKFSFSWSTSSENLIAIEQHMIRDLQRKYEYMSTISRDQQMTIRINNQPFYIQSHSVICKPVYSPDNIVKKYIVLIHGCNSGPSTWFTTTPQLVSDGYEVHCIALPGFGESSVSNDALHLTTKDTLELFVQYIRSYIQTNCPSSDGPRARLIGHSFGAYLATVVSYRFPECCDALVLVNGPGIFPILGSNTIYWCVIFNMGFPNFYARQIGWYINAVVFSWLSLTNCENVHLYWSVAQMTCKNGIGESLTSKFVEFDGLRGRFNCTVLSDVLSSTTTPIAMIWGANDNITPLYLASVFSKFTSNRDHLLPVETINAWHSPMKEPEFANICSGIFDKAKPVLLIDSVRKSKLKRVLNTVYATFNLRDTQRCIDAMVSDVCEIISS